MDLRIHLGGDEPLHGELAKTILGLIHPYLLPDTLVWPRYGFTGLRQFCLKAGSSLDHSTRLKISAEIINALGVGYQVSESALFEAHNVAPGHDPIPILYVYPDWNEEIVLEIPLCAKLQTATKLDPLAGYRRDAYGFWTNPNNWLPGKWLI